MVEWRVFWPYSRHQLNIFDLLKIRSPHNEPSRTDVYYAVTKDVGIKLRCESFLEMKVRNGRDEAGCEQWKKVSTVISIQCMSLCIICKLLN